MSRRLTTEEFIARAEIKHGKKYDYSLSSYYRNNQKIKIKCPVHGLFEQIAHIHYICGCPKCADEELANKTIARNKAGTKTTEEFIEHARKLHGDRYNYGKSVYHHSHTPVTIGCSIHGDFSQTPAVHTSKAKSGCHKCSTAAAAQKARKSPEEFIRQSREIHGDKYDYSGTKYVDSRIKLSIICKLHGEFFTLPNPHLNGSGCRSCGLSGYRTALPGTLYIMQSGTKVKVGITNRSTARRRTEISRNAGSKFEIVKTWTFEDGSVPLRIETKILRHLKQNFAAIPESYNGSTEIFDGIDVNNLISDIEDEM